MNNLNQLEACSICLDEEKLIPSFNVQVEQGFLDSHAVKRLNCGHYFHVDCINKFFFVDGKNCPKCRFQVDEKDTYFKNTKDPYIKNDKIYERYISKKEDGNVAIAFFCEIPDEEKNFLLKKIQFLNNNNQEPSIVFNHSLNFTVRDLTLEDIDDFRSNSSVVFYADESGVCHLNIEE